MARTKMIAIAASTSLLFASCGLVDREAALGEAIDGAIASDINDASSAEAQCLTTTLMTDLGVEGFDEAGVTAEDLLNDPTLLRSEATATTYDEALISCLDLDARFSEAIQLARLDSVDTACVDHDAISEEPLALALIDGDPIAGPETAATVSTALADAIRGCVDDTDFAAVTGLDSPAELAEVLMADPFAKDEIDNRDACIVDSVIGTIGIERLAEIEIDVERPDFLAAVRQLSDEERDSLTAGVETCDLHANLTTFIEDREIQVGACAVDRLSEAEVNELTADLFRGLSITSQPGVREAITFCVEEAVTEIFGTEPEASTFMLEFAVGFVGGVAAEISLNNFERSCVIRGVLTQFDEDGIVAFEGSFRRVEAGAGSAQDLENVQSLFSTSATISNRCVDPWKAVRSEMDLVGISADTQDCIQESKPDLAENLSTASTNAFDGGINEFLEVEDQLQELRQAIESCGTSGELSAWDFYMNDSSGNTENRQSKPIEA